jgi:AhpD family alkylhydroperoxidase
MNQDPLKVIKEIDHELANSINNNRIIALEDGILSKKQKLLIAIALDASKGAESGVKSLAKQALDHGVSKEEIVEAIKVTHFICGVGSVYTAASGLQELF